MKPAPSNQVKVDGFLFDMLRGVVTYERVQARIRELAVRWVADLPDAEQVRFYGDVVSRCDAMKAKEPGRGRWDGE